MKTKKKDMILLNTKLLEKLRTDKGGFTGAVSKELVKIANNNGLKINTKESGWLRKLSNSNIAITQDQFKTLESKRHVYQTRLPYSKKMKKAQFEMIVELLNNYKGVYLDNQVHDELVKEMAKMF